MVASTAAPKGKERFIQILCEKAQAEALLGLAFFGTNSSLSALSVRSDWNGLNEI
jgi:hypothetical protein